MRYHKFVGTVKRTITGILIAGMIVQGMPVFTVEAANQIPGQETNIPGDPGEDTSVETKPGGTEDTGETKPGGMEDTVETKPGGTEDTVETKPGGTEDTGETKPGGTEDTGETKPGGTEDAGEKQPDDTEDTGEIQPGDHEDPVGGQPGGGEDGSNDGSIPGEGQDAEDDFSAVFSVQISGNDISGNDLAADDNEGEEDYYAGGYIELPEDRDVSVVDEAAPIYDYEDGIAPLMSDSPPAQYIPEKGALPLTRDQGSYGSCWAHAAMALAEIDMRNNSGASSDADYSELHLAYFSYNGAVDDPLGGLDGDANYCVGNDFLGRGGNLALAQYVLAGWVGAADEKTAPYSASRISEAKTYGLSKEIAFTDAAHLQNAYQVNIQANPAIAKQMIQTYGALGTSCYYDANAYYNDDHKSYYCNMKTTVNHGVAVVGWDDTFSADHFNTKPEGDGAWLIRNSWKAGEDADSRSRQTYFWMSYYDKSLAAGYAFDFESADNYHHNYQYDGSMATTTWSAQGTSVYTANVFTAGAYEGGEQLKAVGIAFAKAQTPYTVTIYKNLKDPANPESGTLISEAAVSGTCGCEGFYTIPLSQPVPLAKGDTFSVVVQFGPPAAEPGKVYWSAEGASDAWYRCEADAQPGQSFYKLNDTWNDHGKTKHTNLRIKAYTVDDDGSAEFPAKIELAEKMKQGVAIGVGDSFQASCTVLPRSASDRSIQWESSNPAVATVDETGLITGVSEGNAEITVTCNAHAEGAKPVTASFSVEVCSELKSLAIKGYSRVTVGKTITLQAVPTPSGALAAVTWSSSDERVVKVDAGGKVTGVAPGYAAVTAKLGTITATKQITCAFTDVSITGVSSTAEGITITWKGDPGAAGYQIYRVEGSSWKDSDSTAVAAVPGDSYSYLDKAVTANKTYLYKVVATVKYIKGDGYEEKTVRSSVSRYTMPAYYSIAYELDGGTNAEGNPSIYCSSSNVTLLNPTKRGYDFQGWYKENTYENRVTVLNSSSVKADLTLYAKWNPHIYHIVYTDGGTHSNPVSYSIETPVIILQDAEKPGYQFAGWYRDAAYTQKMTQIEPSLCADVTLYAKWQEPIITAIRIESRPTRTTYKVGEALDLSGGEVSFEPGQLIPSVPMEKEMISGFDSSAPGICAVTVTVRGCTAAFDTLIVAEPQLRADYGQRLSELTLPADSYGVYSWRADEGMELTRAGLQSVPVSFTPNDLAAFQTLDSLNAQVTVAEAPDEVPDEEPKNHSASVSFDVQGHGTAPETIRKITVGSTIDEPVKPTADGYTFKGWCKDAACTQDWKFDTDIVQSDLTLYAKWLRKSTQPDSQFQMQEIADIYYYTGSALKPSVNVYDGDTLLKAGRDYTVKYVNNINANAGGVWKKGSGMGADFNPGIPYAQITGRGNYTDEIKVNFDIHPAVIGDGEGNPAKKVVLRYTDQFAAADRELKPFGSIRYTRAMKLNQDYTLELTAKNVRDGSGSAVQPGQVFAGAVVPKGYEGEFTLTVTGAGNYTGEISRDVYVTDKQHLMKNAKITLGKNQKRIELVGEKVELQPSTAGSADTFTVKLGQATLTPERDYTVSYQEESNRKVGKAILVITGVGEYKGTKTISFNITGKPFTAAKVKVTGVEEKVYTGKAITQNDAVLVYNAGKPDEKRLVYGADYTVSYMRNINKGTATMTFTGSKEAGFSGSFKKTFRILAAPIDNTDAVKRTGSWNAIVEPYSKAGAKPDIKLENVNGIRLQKGKDYTLSYQNNRLVAGAAAKKAPTVTVRGKGNYQGSFSVPFTIDSADLETRISGGEITIKTAAVAYQPNRNDDYVYKPAVKLLEGRTALRAGVDYTVTYKNNTQAAYEAYIKSVDAGTDASAPAPQVVIGAGSGNTYRISEEPAPVPLTIYRHKLTKANLRVEYAASDCVYTGGQVTPEVQVSYLGDNGTTKLVQGKDYTVSYGTNVKSGRGAGKITISGTGTLYGGDVTVSFEISKKKIIY